MAVFTIGHSTRAIEEFLGLLRQNGVGLLVDVRRFPGSRRYPHFNSEALERSLEEAGIRYRHEPEMGGRRKGRPDSPNQGWRNTSFRAYADHLDSPEFRAALDRLRADEAAAPAIMCAEAVPWRCHRRLIADALVARGVEVRHIISPTSVTTHELNPMARVDDQGRITYPDQDADQQTLF